MRFKFILVSMLIANFTMASEYPSKETAGEIGRDSSVDALMYNEAIKAIDKADIKKARKVMCSNMDVNLMLLGTTLKLYPNVEREIIEKSLRKISADGTDCDFSDESKELLKLYS
jgi:hypothetical protein